MNCECAMIGVNAFGDICAADGKPNGQYLLVPAALVGICHKTAGLDILGEKLSRQSRNVRCAG